MARHINAQTGCTLAVAALLACLAGPVSAQSAPLPMPRPAIQAATGTIVAQRAAVPEAALRARAQAPAPAGSAQPPNPVSNPFAALLGKPGSTTALSPEQRSIIEKVNNYLSSMQVLSGKFVQVAPDGRRSRRRVLYFQARPRALRI